MNPEVDRIRTKCSTDQVLFVVWLISHWRWQPVGGAQSIIFIVRYEIDGPDVELRHQRLRSDKNRFRDI